MDIIKSLSEEFHLQYGQIERTVKLLDDGNTVPFIARYRKEITGSLDDQILRSLSERLNYLRSLDEAREKIRSSIAEQNALSNELSASIDSASTLTELEDIYRPYKKKRKTRASAAKEKGLAPLAEKILAQLPNSPSPGTLAADYTNTESGTITVNEAINGAQDIIAEQISDNADIRRKLRFVCSAHGILTSKAISEDCGVYSIYADYSEPLSKIPSHRILAINRGEKENILRVGIEFSHEKAMYIIEKEYVRDGSECTATVRAAAADAYTRLIFPSVERELRAELTEKAGASAISVFSKNLYQLLMQPPIRGKITLGMDPGYRTGCKLAAVDETGKLLETGVIYPAPPHKKTDEAKKTVIKLIKKYNIQVLAIGNGTASRETEAFAAELIKEFNCGISYIIVSEAGASVYSASPLAAKEFPDYDVSLRSAVSIARRIQDPLAELVKIEPKAIGVGQYQHDMPQSKLNAALDGVVEDCVNSVGVDLNTASVPLLSRVAGLNTAVANNIVAYRETNGAFTSRTQLKKVPRLGPLSFEQCAGFLRIPGGKNPLDNTAVHPESYEAAEKLLKLCGYPDKAIAEKGAEKLSAFVKQHGESILAEKLGIGIPTLRDIVLSLEKPGRDPRDELPLPLLRTDVMTIEDIKPGMELFGTVRNVIDFGAFIDIGVHEDGLVHISQITDRYLKHPSEILKVGDTVKVRVISCNIEKKRIALTMRKE